MKNLDSLPLNIRNALFELKGKLENRFRKRVEIYLFGSYARGENIEYSDIDILVVLENEVNTSKEIEIFDVGYEIELKYNVVFGIIVYSKSHWERIKHLKSPLCVNIEKEGISV